MLLSTGHDLYMISSGLIVMKVSSSVSEVMILNQKRWTAASGSDVSLCI